MKVIQTNSFQKLSSDFKRQPGSFPGENDSGQSSLFDKPDRIEDKLKRKNKLPSSKIYQLGVDSPDAKPNESGML